MKSAIRIAYDNLAEVIAKEVTGMNRAAMATLNNGSPVAHSSVVTPRQDVLDQLSWSSIPEIVKNYEMQIEYNRERLKIAQELYDEWLTTHNQRRETLIELFRMLPKEEQDEIMLDKLTQ